MAEHITGEGGSTVVHRYLQPIYLRTKKMTEQHKSTGFKNPPGLLCGAGLEMKNFKEVIFRLRECLSCAALPY